MHSCYALGALLCPFIIAGAGLIGPVIPMLSLSFLGLVMWIIFQLTPIEKKTAGKKEKTDWDFLKSKRFWLLTGLIFCQNAVSYTHLDVYKRQWLYKTIHNFTYNLANPPVNRGI